MLPLEMLEDGSFSGIAIGKYCRISQEGDTISFFDITPEDFNALWRSYFDLDRDYGALKERLSQNPILAEAARFAPGIRILHQDHWEALCSFILSQNNNIKRIKGLVLPAMRAIWRNRRRGIRLSPAPIGWRSFPPMTLGGAMRISR